VLRGIVGSSPVERGRPVRTRINGLDAVILPVRAQARSGLMEVVVAAYSVGGERVYHFATIAPEGRGAVFDPMYDSFRRLSEREAGAGGGPQRIAVVTVRPGDTAESLSDRMAGEAPLGRFLMLNGLERGEPLEPGRRVKIVTGGPRRPSGIAPGRPPRP
jgi:predicted Zn-dependent protease